MARFKANGDDKTITVRVPIAIRKRGGRKLVISPNGSPTFTVGVRIDNALLKALARAFRWREMLEGGQFANIREIANEEKINESYVGRVLRLTLLAPDIVEAVLAGHQPPSMQLDIVLQRFSVDWPSQRDEMGVI